MNVKNLSLVLSACLIFAVAVGCDNPDQQNADTHGHAHDHECDGSHGHDHADGHGHAHGHKHPYSKDEHKASHKAAKETLKTLEQLKKSTEESIAAQKENLTGLKKAILDSNAELEAAYEKACPAGSENPKSEKCAKARKFVDQQIEANNKHLAEVEKIEKK